MSKISKKQRFLAETLDHQSKADLLSYHDRYQRAKQEIDAQELTLAELQQYYLDGIDALILLDSKLAYDVKFRSEQYFKLSPSKHPSSPSNTPSPLSTRLNEELKKAICRLIALEIIPYIKQANTVCF